MLKSSFSKNKRSAIEVSLIHLLEIILAIGIVILLIYLALKLSGLFLSRQEHDSTINNMEALANRINELVRDNKDIAIKTMVYNIPDSYILVGFSYDDKGTIKTECTQENIVNSRPKSCQAKSCLCIYQNFNGADFDSKGDVTPLKCKPFNEKILFLATSDSNFKGAQTQWKPTHYQWPNYNYFVLYGICRVWPLGTSFGIKQIYIEKYKEGENIFIFIGDMSDKKIVERSSYFKSKNP